MFSVYSMLVIRLEQSLFSLQIRNSTCCLFLDCVQLTQIRKTLYFRITLQSSIRKFTQHWFSYQTLNSEVLKRNILHIYGFKPNCVPYYKAVKREKFLKKTHLLHKKGFLPSWIKWYRKLQHHPRNRKFFWVQTATTCGPGI